MVKGQVVLLLDESNLPSQLSPLNKQFQNLLVNFVNPFPPVLKFSHLSLHLSPNSFADNEFATLRLPTATIVAAVC